MESKKIRLALPKGRMYGAVTSLLAEAGFRVAENGRNYRPPCADERFELKILKPQNIVRMVELGSHDVAFAGHDWVVELGARVVELLDTGLDPVRVVAAAPRELAAAGPCGAPPRGGLRVRAAEPGVPGRRGVRLHLRPELTAPPRSSRRRTPT